MEEYLTETSSIDYMNSHIQEKVEELKNQSTDTVDYIKQSYIFVRDETYQIRSETGEIDYHDNHPDLDRRLEDMLAKSENISEITTDFEL